MDVYFLRHGKAEKHADCDENRILTSEGEETIRRLGKVLQTLKISPTHLYTSPYLRAAQTADILNQGLTMPLEIKTKKRLRCGAHTAKILDLLVDHSENDRVILVGHMPDFAEITQTLLGLLKPMTFETGSLIGLNWKNHPGKNSKANLLLALHPSQYAV